MTEGGFPEEVCTPADGAPDKAKEGAQQPRGSRAVQPPRTHRERGSGDGVVRLVPGILSQGCGLRSVSSRGCGLPGISGRCGSKQPEPAVPPGKVQAEPLAARTAKVREGVHCPSKGSGCSTGIASNATLWNQGGNWLCHLTDLGMTLLSATYWNHPPLRVSV